MEGYKLECIRPHDFVPPKKLPKLSPQRKRHTIGRAATLFLFAGLLTVPTSVSRPYSLSDELPSQTDSPTVTDITIIDDDGFYSSDLPPDLAANPPAGQPEVSVLTPNNASDSVTSLTIAPSSTAGYVYFDGIYVKNGSGKAIDIEAQLEASCVFSSAPRVLIIHTHACEAYTPDKYDGYTASPDDRNTDCRYNVVRVGDELAAALEELGIAVIHDRTLYDHPEYSGAYSRSLASVQEYLEQYPDIEIILDIHRDALNDPGQTKYKLVCNDMAQLMFVVGTDANGEVHPSWQNNLSFALKLQAAALELVPGIARPIKLTAGSYNQFVAPGALIVEIGANGNTLSEAIAAAGLLAECLAKVLY